MDDLLNLGSIAGDIMDHAILLMAIIVGLVIFLKGKINGWRRITDFALLGLFPLAMMAGEMWSMNQGSIPWLFGAEEEMSKRADLNPLAFLIMLAGLLFIIRFMFFRGANIYTHTRWLPGAVGPGNVSVFLLATGLYLVFVGGAYAHKSSGSTLGHDIVNTERHALIRGSNALSGILSGDTEMSTSKNKTKYGQSSSRPGTYSRSNKRRQQPGHESSAQFWKEQSENQKQKEETDSTKKKRWPGTYSRKKGPNQ